MCKAIKPLWKRVVRFFEDHILFSSILAVVCITIIALLICSYIQCGQNIVGGFLVLAAAPLTAIIGIRKYESEQRTLRLQKLYFEDTLLSLASSIEEALSQTNKNMYSMESLLNITSNIAQQDIDIGLKKENLIVIYDEILKIIEAGIKTTDFKKETVSKFLYDSGIENCLVTWISVFEADTCRFSEFLKTEIIIYKMNLNKINEDNLNQFLDAISNSNIQAAYSLVKRHYVLLTLYSEIVLSFSSENYSTMKNLIEAFQKSDIKSALALINQAYSKLINEFEKVDFFNITKEESARVDEKQKCMLEKISSELWKQ